jgi:hypothetical protein
VLKATKNAKIPFAAAKYSPVKNGRYVRGDAFDVEFDDGLCISNRVMACLFRVERTEEYHKHCQDEWQKPCSIIEVLA